MITAFNSNTRFLVGGSYQGGREWTRHSNEQDKCFKIYYFRHGAAKIHSCKLSYDLIPGRVYFLNGYSVLSQECPAFMSVDWFHFQLESLYLEKILKSASCVVSFDIQNLSSFLRVFDKLQAFFLNISSLRDARISILEIQSLIQFVIARIIDEKEIDISEDHHKINRLLPALDFINQHYRERISLSQLAEKCHYSPNYFNRLFRSTLNIPPLRYIQQRRMEDASRLLTYSSTPIKEISSELGYDDPAYFSRIFHQTFKMSPSGFRIRNHKKMP